MVGNNGSVRRVRPNARSITGIYNSRFGPLQFESQLERDSYILLDFSPWVMELNPQPLRVGYYTPDCSIRTTTNAYLIVEVKYQQELIENWNSFDSKFREASFNAARIDATFGFITDRGVYADGELIDVLKWIRYSARKKADISEALEHQLARIFRSVDTIPLGRLAAAISAGSCTNPIDAICRLVTEGRLNVIETPSSDPLDAIVISRLDSNDTVHREQNVFTPYQDFLKTFSSQIESGETELDENIDKLCN